MTTQGGNRREKKRALPESDARNPATIEHTQPPKGSDFEQIAREIAGDEALSIEETVHQISDRDIVEQTNTPAKHTKTPPPPPPRRTEKKGRDTHFNAKEFPPLKTDTELQQEISEETLNDLAQKIIKKYEQAISIAARSTRVNDTSRWKPYIKEIQTPEIPKKRDKDLPPEAPKANYIADAGKLLRDAGIDHIKSNDELQKLIDQKIQENSKDLTKIRETEEIHGSVTEVGAGIFVQREALNTLRLLFEADSSTSPSDTAKLLDQIRERNIAQAHKDRNDRLTKERKEDEPFRKEVSQRISTELGILLSELEDQKAKKHHSPTQPMQTITLSLWEKVKSLLPTAKERPEVATYQPAYESVEELEKDIGVDSLKTTDFTPFEDLEGVLGSRFNRISDEIEKLLADYAKYNTPLQITTLEDVITLGDINLKKLIIQQESIARSMVIIENRKHLDKVIFERRQKKRSRTTKLFALTNDFRNLKTRVLTKVMASLPRAQM